MDQSVESHYTVTDLGERILSALENMGKDGISLTPPDLAPVDEFPIRGSKATQELARIAVIQAVFLNPALIEKSAIAQD